MADPAAIDVVRARPRLMRPQPGRYRYPGDVARLAISGVLLVAAVIAALLAPERLLGSRATTITGVKPGTSEFRLIVGLLQGLAVVTPVALAFTVLRRQRFRLFLSVVVAGAGA